MNILFDNLDLLYLKKDICDRRLNYIEYLNNDMVDDHDIKNIIQITIDYEEIINILRKEKIIIDSLVNIIDQYVEDVVDLEYVLKEYCDEYEETMFIEINVRGYVCFDMLNVNFYVKCDLMKNNKREFSTLVHNDNCFSFIEDYVDTDFKNYQLLDHIDFINYYLKKKIT